MEAACALFNLAPPTAHHDAAEMWAVARALRQRAAMEDGPSAFEEAANAFFSTAQDAALNQLPSQARAALLSEAATAAAIPASRSHVRLPSSGKFCSACKSEIDEGQQIVEELGTTWHVPCFGLAHICAHCGRSIALSVQQEGSTEFCVVNGTAVVHCECAAEYSNGVVPSHRLAVSQDRFVATVRVVNGLRVHPGGELLVRADLRLQASMPGPHWWTPSPVPAKMRLRLVRTECRREGFTERTTKTTICKSEIPHLMRLGDTAEALLAVPSSTPPSVGGDRAFSREYFLKVVFRFRNPLRHRQKAVFPVIITTIPE